MEALFRHLISHKARVLIVLSLGWGVPAGPVLAAWEAASTASARILQRSLKVDVAPDGSFVTQDETLTEILRDGARDDLGTMTEVWNADASKLLEVKAWTINKGRAVPVPKKHIDTNSVSYGNVGFDNFKRTMISFPEVLVGSQIKVLFRVQTQKVPVVGLYSDRRQFGRQYPEKAGSLFLYRSAKPLELFVFDPGSYLSSRQWQEEGRYYSEVKLIKDAYFQLKNEDNAWEERPLFPYFEVSSHKDWEDMRRQMTEGFENEIRAEMPKSFLEQVETIKLKESSLVGRSDLWTSWLVDKVRYMGDWRTVKGGYHPRPLAEVEKSGFGDCKDYASVTVKALRHLGYKAHVAIVRRGWERGYPIDLPRVGAFNHAIVYAEDEAGKAYWIDPTNPSSYARGKRPDIAGRPALVLTRETETKGLSEIPSIQPSDMRYYSRYEYWPVSLNARKVVFQFRAFGSGALDLSGRELRESRERIEREMLEWVTDSSEILRAKMDPFDLSSRIVKDIQIQGEVEHKWVPTRSTAGLGHQISQSFYGLQRVILKERNAGYHLGIPYRKEDEYVFKESRLVGQPLRECKIDSPWLYAERLIEQRENDIHVRNVIEKRQVGISLADLKSEKMREVRQKLRTCFGSMTMIYTLPDRLMTDVPMDEEEETLAH